MTSARKANIAKFTNMQLLHMLNDHRVMFADYLTSGNADDKHVAIAAGILSDLYEAAIARGMRNI